MNTLGFRTSDENGLSFELQIDQQPLGALIGNQDGSFPYWIVDDNLPYLPPHGGSRVVEYHIVCVCSCGEYGCGHTRCRIVLENDTVVFRDFECDVSAEGAKKEFRFSKSNFDAVVTEIVKHAHTHAEK